MSWGVLVSAVKPLERPVVQKCRSRVIKTVDKPIIDKVRVEVVAHTARWKAIFPRYNPNALSRRHNRSQPSISVGIDKYKATGRFPKAWPDALIADVLVFIEFQRTHKTHKAFAAYYGVSLDVINRLHRGRPLLRRSATAIAKAWREKGPLGMPEP